MAELAVGPFPGNAAPGNVFWTGNEDGARGCGLGVEFAVEDGAD